MAMTKEERAALKKLKALHPKTETFSPSRMPDGGIQVAIKTESFTGLVPLRWYL